MGWLSVLTLTFVLGVALPQVWAQEEVSFSADLASVLSKRCMGCHGGNRPRQDLRIESFESMMVGGENGPIIEAGSPDDSLMILKMKGEADGDRMPPNGSPLSDKVIAKFAAWIQAGARFDGKDPTFRLDRLATTSRLAKMSEAELVAEATEQAKKKWALAFPGETPQTRLTGDLLLVARNTDEEQNPELDQVAKQLAKSIGAVRKLLGVTDVKLKSPLTIFHIPRSYDFSEFTQMVERRESSSGLGSEYWRPDGGMGYLVLGPSNKNKANSRSSRNDKPRLRLSVAQTNRFACALLLNRFGAPGWYANGVSLLAYEQAGRRSRLVAAWKATAPSAVSKARTSKGIFDSDLPSGEADAALWAWAKFIASDRKRMSRLHQAIARGNAFDRSFEGVFGKPADKMCDDWLAWLKGRRRK